jgi:hypothetical protein
MLGVADNVHPLTDNPDLVLRYSATGNAFAFPSNNISTDYLLPQIVFSDVPVTIAIDNLARLAGIKYELDPKIGYIRHDRIGGYRPEPEITARWEWITAYQALQAVLNQSDLQLVAGSGTNISRITVKNPALPKMYVSPEVEMRMEWLLNQVLGTNLVGAQALALLNRSPSDVKPVRIVMQSERPVEDRDIIAFFTQTYPNPVARQGSPRIYVEPSGTNCFRVMVDAVSAVDYLAWSDQFNPEFYSIGMALKRPYARMDGDYSQCHLVPVPDVAAVRLVSHVLAQRAQCNLLLGKPEEALSDLQMLNDFRKVQEAQPSGKLVTVMAAMMNVAVAGVYTDTIKDGFRLHAWKEPQLVALQGQLEKINLLPFLAEGLKAEPVGMCRLWESMCISKGGQFTAKLGGNRVPMGWFYQNMVIAARLDHMLWKGFEPINGVISPQRCDQIGRDINSYLANDTFRKKLTIYFRLLAMVAIPNFVKAEQVAAYNQTMIDEARIACALERYHLAHAEYPLHLDALQPQFINAIPRDIIGGEALKYRRLDNGRYLLYSVGWNELDENGLEHAGGSLVRDQGDWVWRGW